MGRGAPADFAASTVMVTGMGAGAPASGRV